MRNKFVLWMYVKSPSIIKKLIRKIYGKNVKMECESEILREIWEQYYGVKIGKYTYGCFNDSFPAGTTVGKYLPRSYSPPGGQSADPVSHHCHNHGISPDG